MSTPKGFLYPREHALLSERIGSGVVYLLLIKNFEGRIAAHIWLTIRCLLFFLLILWLKLRHLLIGLFLEAVVHMRVFLHGGGGMRAEIADYPLSGSGHRPCPLLVPHQHLLTKCFFHHVARCIARRENAVRLNEVDISSDALADAG